MNLGIIGVGHLAASLLAGFRRSGMEAAAITVSPRGMGPELARRHGHRLARDNAELVAACDHVVLAVRPDAAVAAIEGLPWRRGQLLMSACAGVPLAALAPAAPARVVRIMPLTASELGASPTLLCPPDAQALELLQRLGPAVELADEDQFEVATVSAAIYGWAQALIAAGADWSAANGLDPDTARQLVARTFVAAGRMVSEKDAPVQRLLEELVTPGGITEAGLRHLEGKAVPQAWSQACDIVLARLRGNS